MFRKGIIITITLVAVALTASCGRAETTAFPTPSPAATLPRVTVVVTATPTPIPTATPEAGNGTVLLIFGQQFIYDIYIVVRPALEEAGYRVVVASRSTEPLQAKNISREVAVDLLLEDVRVEDCDAILFNCDNDITFGSARAESDRIAREAVAQGRVLGAICSGPRVLAYADVVEGLQTTGEPSQTCAMLEQSGATCTGAEIERDGWIITARDRYTSQAYVQAIIEAMQEQTAASPLGHGAEGLIAFVSTRDGNGEIYVMAAPGGPDADGSDQRRLTDYRQWDGFPDWSPDGRQIAYYSYLSDKNWVIKVMDIDGGNARQLTDGGDCDGAPHWSPDGTRITYDSGDCTGDHREIYVMAAPGGPNADGGAPVNLSNNAADDMLAAWSPDSTQLVFSSNRDGNYELYVMDADGGNVRRLTENAAADHAPAWSPDGTQIAFYSERDGNAEIYVMDAPGGPDADGDEQGSHSPRNLTNHPADDWFPRWSPDGSQITFSSKRDGNLEIYVMAVPDRPDADGGEQGSSNVRRLTNSPGDDFNSVWQPRPVSAHSDTWVKTYVGDLSWAAFDGLVTDDGGYLLVGATNHSHENTAREDVYLVKTDPTGEIVWAKTFGGDDFDRGEGGVAAEDGAFVIVGETASFGAGDWDVYLLKVDQDGNEMWAKTFGGPGRERANAVQPTSDGGYIVVGSTAPAGSEAGDVYLIKVDAAGDEIWAKSYGGEYGEEGNAIYPTPDGGYFVVAELVHNVGVYTQQNPDIFLLKVDASGNEVWSNVWEEDGVQGGYALAPTADGGYVIAGFRAPPGSESSASILFVKIDADGHKLWDKPIGDAGEFVYGTDVVGTADSGYLLTGMAQRAGQGSIPLIKTDANGDVVWTRCLIEGRGNRVGMKVLPTADGGYLIVGQDNARSGSTRFETVSIKTDSAGNVMEEMTQ